MAKAAKLVLFGVPFSQKYGGMGGGEMLYCIPIKQILDPGGMAVNHCAERIFINREEYIINLNDRAG